MESALKGEKNQSRRCCRRPLVFRRPRASLCSGRDKPRKAATLKAGRTLPYSRIAHWPVPRGQPSTSHDHRNDLLSRPQAEVRP
eukprot:7384531-Prymnesium_polylepis.2